LAAAVLQQVRGAAALRQGRTITRRHGFGSAALQHGLASVWQHGLASQAGAGAGAASQAAGAAEQQLFFAGRQRPASAGLANTKVASSASRVM